MFLEGWKIAAAVFSQKNPGVNSFDQENHSVLWEVYCTAQKFSLAESTLHLFNKNPSKGQAPAIHGIMTVFWFDTIGRIMFSCCNAAMEPNKFSLCAAAHISQHRELWGYVLAGIFFSLWGCSLLLEISHTLCIKGSCSGAAWTLISVSCYPVGWFWLSYRDLSLTRDEIPLLEYVVWTNYFAGLLMHTPHFKIPMGYYLRWCIFHLSVLPSIVNTHSTLKNPKHFLCRL